MWLWLWDSGIVLDSQQNCGGPPLLEMYQSRMISVIKLRLWVMPALFFLSLDSWQTFLRTYLLSFQEAVLMQTQWGCYWRDGCRKCPDLADHSAFWTEKKKNLFCAFLPPCARLFLISEEWWNFELGCKGDPWSQKHITVSAFWEGEKKTHEELQTQLVTIQPERDMRSRQRAYKKWKKGANMENCILQVRKYGEKVRSVKSWSVLHLVKEIKTHCKIFFSHINK